MRTNLPCINFLHLGKIWANLQNFSQLPDMWHSQCSSSYGLVSSSNKPGAIWKEHDWQMHSEDDCLPHQLSSEQSSVREIQVADIWSCLGSHNNPHHTHSYWRPARLSIHKIINCSAFTFSTRVMFTRIFETMTWIYDKQIKPHLNYEISMIHQ